MYISVWWCIFRGADTEHHTWSCLYGACETRPLQSLPEWRT